MSKKLLIGLMPILATLAMMPAAAQATPHYFRNGVLLPGGERVPVLEWGKLSLRPEPDEAAGTTCENLAGGYVENPVGGGAGIGATLRFATYNCNNVECPSGEIEVKGQQYEKEFEISYPPQDFPWSSVLEEPEAGVVKTNISHVTEQLACVAHGLTRAAAGEGGSTGAGEDEQFVLPMGGPPTVTCVTDETHQWTLQDEKGANAGPAQSKLVFNAGAGSVNCAGGAFNGLTKESLRIMGYKGSELITVH
jgi:hypothetical protein